MRWFLCAVSCALVGCVAARAEILKVNDRKFPTGKYCPFESRATSGADLSFVAPAATVRITFAGDNLDAFNQWNSFRIDNVAVVSKSVFDAHQVIPPDFEDCYNIDPPPGQATGGDPNAPAYDFNAAGTPEIFLDLFASGITGWTGSHLSFDGFSNAPTDPATGSGTTGGSLRLGEEDDGDVPVSASRIISGLTPGATYVLTAWWYAALTSPLTMKIGVPCADPDADGYVVCGACDPQATETCGECNNANPHCGPVCTDADGDGWCPPLDCSDASSTCTSDCATNLDGDALPDCRDGCVDPDLDGYGTVGGGASTCLGSDCAPTNQWCNVSCVDNDGDGHCSPGDCQDSNPAVANGLVEVNDCLDQQCPGDLGFGVTDEVSGNGGFVTPGSTTVYSWPAQSGAVSYRAVRSSSPTFPSGCASLTTIATSWTDAAVPAAGSIFHYLVHPETVCKGSWGQRSTGSERSTICGMETACGNGVDDDVDAATDCADADCTNTAPCRVQTFAFFDTVNDDKPDDALRQFFQSATAGVGDYLFFELLENPTRQVSWCSVNAAYYKTQYLALAQTFGTVTSGAWNKWRKAPSTANAWVADNAGHVNNYGDDCFGLYSWCSEQFSFEPQNSIFPNRTNDCEAYDLATGSCGAQTGETWLLTIRIASTRQAACGF